MRYGQYSGPSINCTPSSSVEQDSFYFETSPPKLESANLSIHFFTMYPSSLFAQAAQVADCLNPLLKCFKIMRN